MCRQSAVHLNGWDSTRKLRSKVRRSHGDWRVNACSHRDIRSLVRRLTYELTSELSYEVTHELTCYSRNNDVDNLVRVVVISLRDGIQRFCDTIIGLCCRIKIPLPSVLVLVYSGECLSCRVESLCFLTIATPILDRFERGANF